jgi:hypothetical protein
MKSLRPVYTIGPGHGMKTVSKKRVGTVAQCLVRWVTQVLHLDSYARSYGEPRELATMVMRRAGAGSSGHWKVKTDLEALACGVVALLQQPWAAVMPSIIRLSTRPSVTRTWRGFKSQIHAQTRGAFVTAIDRAQQRGELPRLQDARELAVDSRPDSVPAVLLPRAF